MDTFGPIQRSKQGNKFFVVLVCQFTGYLAGFATASKSNIPREVIKVLKILSKNINRKPEQLHVLRSDQGTEFKNSTLSTYCEKKAIVHNFSSPYFPSENGKVERAVRTVKTVTKILLVSSQLTTGFWDWAALYALEIINVLPKVGNTKSPYELFTHKTPQLERYRVFGAPGCIVTSSGKDYSKKKLHKSTHKIRFMGFASQSKQYVVWNIQKRKFEEARDIYLDESKLVSTSYRRFAQGFEVDTVPAYFDVERQLQPRKITKPIVSNTVLDEEVPVDDFDISPDVNSQPGDTISTSPVVAPTSIRNFCDIHEDNIIVGPRRRQQVAKVSSNTIPRSFYEVTLSPEKDSWMIAFNQEVHSLESTAGMTVVSRPKNTFIIPVRTLFEVKYDNLLKLTKKKCRIVARGDIQKRFLGKNTKFSAPVSSPVALKLLLI